MTATDRIRITCPGCKKPIRVRPEQSGKRVRCPNKKCARVISVPQPRGDRPARAKVKPTSRWWPWLPFGASAGLLGLIVVGAIGAWLLTRNRPAPPVASAEEVKETPDETNLAKDGPGDPALTYDVVAKSTAKHRGRRVTWTLTPCSSEGKRMMCALDQREALGPEHKGIYVVEFESEREATDAFLAAASQPGAGGVVTGTVAGDIDQFLVVKDRNGKAQKDIPKVTVPLLRYPIFQAQKGESNPVVVQNVPSKPKSEPKANPKTTPEVPKKEENPKTQAITKDSLIGDWKGTLANGKVDIKLNDKLAVVAFWFDGGGFAIGSVGWSVDAKTNDIRVDQAKATLTKDSSLTIAGRIRIGNVDHVLPETKLQRQPAGKTEPKTSGSEPKSKASVETPALPGAAGERVDYPRRPPLLWAVFLATPDKLPKGGPTAPFNQVLPSETKKVTIGVVFHQEPLVALVSVRLKSNSGEVKLANAKQDWLKINATYIRYVDLIAANEPFPDGPYQAEVSINGKTVALVNYTVGKAPAAVALRRGASGPAVDVVGKPPEALQVKRFFLTDDPKKVPGPKDPVLQRLASGTKEFWVGLVLAKKPSDGTNLSLLVFDEKGIIKMPPDFKDIRTTAAGEFVWLIPCSPEQGAFADGRYQAQIYLDGVRYAFLNWSMGEQANK